MSWHKQNSDTQSEPKLQEQQNGTVVQVQSGQKTVGVCLVQVTTPQRQSWLGFWTGLELYQTVFPVQPGQLAGHPDPLLPLLASECV